MPSFRVPPRVASAANARSSPTVRHLELRRAGVGRCGGGVPWGLVEGGVARPTLPVLRVLRLPF